MQFEPRSEEGLKGSTFQVKQVAEARANQLFLGYRCEKCPVFRAKRHSSSPPPNHLGLKHPKVPKPFFNNEEGQTWRRKQLARRPLRSSTLPQRSPRTRNCPRSRPRASRPTW